MRILSLPVAVACLLAAASASAQDLSDLVLDDVDLGQQVSGPPLGHHDLEGRVVLCYHWCVSCPMSTGAFPYVNGLVAKYRDRGLVVVGLQVRRHPDVEENDVVWYVEHLKPDFPVTRLGWVCEWPVDWLPWAVVFDHRGRAIFADNLPGIEAVLEEALDAAPDWLVGGPHERIAELAGRIAADREHAGVHLEAVRELIRRPDADPGARAEARALVAAVEAYFDRQLAKAAESPGGPVDRALVLRSLAEMFDGDPLGDAARRRHAELIEATPDFASEVEARIRLDRARTAHRRLPPPGRYIYHPTDMNYRDWESPGLREQRGRMIVLFRRELERIATEHPDTHAAAVAEELLYEHEVPELAAEEARERLSRAARLAGSDRSIDVAEAHLLLAEVSEGYLEHDELSKEADRLLAALGKEQAREVAAGIEALRSLERELQAVEAEVREGGSALSWESAEAGIGRMRDVAARAGESSELARRVRGTVKRLAESFSGPAHLGVGIDDAFEGPGVRVARVYPATAAEASGIAVGDVILEIAGERLEDLGSLREAIAACRPGQKVKVVLRRAGSEADETVEVVLGRRLR